MQYVRLLEYQLNGFLAHFQCTQAAGVTRIIYKMRLPFNFSLYQTKREIYYSPLPSEPNGYNR